MKVGRADNVPFVHNILLRTYEYTSDYRTQAIRNEKRSMQRQERLFLYQYHHLRMTIWGVDFPTAEFIGYGHVAYIAAVGKCCRVYKLMYALSLTQIP